MTQGTYQGQEWGKNFEPKKSSEGNVLPFQIFAEAFPVTLLKYSENLGWIWVDIQKL